MSTAKAKALGTGSIRALAKKLGIPRSTFYYRLKQPAKDWHLKNQIEKVMHDNPSYGCRRNADALKLGKNRIHRVMKLYGIKPYRRRGKKWRKPGELGVIHPNLIQDMPFPSKTNVIWASDFTRLPFHGRVLYLATIKDIFDRRIVGWALLSNHGVELVLMALIDAVEKYGRPEVLHSDQGSEYKSWIYAKFARSLGIKLSMSRKASPWENGYQEGFYSQFKVDVADINRFRTTGELVAEIYRQIHYYNHTRIHGQLKMPPAQFAERR